MDVHSIFTVDLEGGRLYWRRPSKYHNEKIGMEAGTARPTHAGKKYWIVRVNGKTYRRGQLIYYAAHGAWPRPCLDHINGDSLDDRIGNLRAATVTQNAWNHKRRARRIQLPMGVRSIGSGRYQARISHNKKQIHLGAYDTPEQAHAAYAAKRKELYGEWA